MTPEEKFNQEVWWVLQKIKEESLATPKGKSVKDDASKLKLKAIFATPTYSAKSRQIADHFSPENRQFVLMVLKEIVRLIDFSTDGKVDYRLGQIDLREERLLLPKLEQLGLFKYLGEDEIFAIATLENLDIKLIKEIIARLEELESGVITSDEFGEINEIKGEEKKPKVKGNIQSLLGSTPYTVTKDGWGYLKFGEHGKKKKIGKASSRHFKLLQTMLSPVGVSKTVESVFEAIRLPKDKNDTHLSDWNTSATRKMKLIRYAIKELQKGNKLEGKIKFEFNDTKTQLKAVLLD